MVHPRLLTHPKTNTNEPTDGQMHEAVAAIAATGVSPLVRIAANEAWMVKRALDAGAHGIVVPLIYTVDDARRLVSSTKFPPLGTRGFGSPFSPQTFSNESMVYYLQNANATLQTIVQIETKSALECVEDIAALPGVDCLLIGPFDLGNNIGRPILGAMHQELRDAIGRIKDAAHKHGKKVGIYCTSGEQSKGFADMGFDMISIAADMLALQAHFAETLAVARGEGKEKGGAGYDGR
jgi:4-hydroxy-2-oxoheptanedioate aldolase